MKIRQLIFAGILFAIGLNAVAGNKEDTAKKFVDIQGNMQHHLESTLNNTQRQVKQFGLEDEDLNEINAILIKHFPEDKIKKALVKHYSELFTLEELQELVAIYQQPVMQKIVADFSNVQESMSDVMAEYGQVIQKDLMEFFQQKLSNVALTSDEG